MPGAASPCMGICVLDPTQGICTGCGRSLAEIGGWMHMTDEQRVRVKRELGRRLRALRKGNG
jgi:uncharacterized protein